MQKKQLIGRKPAYFRHQLLLEDDFTAEQRYHASARYRHSLNLHGWGVVRGLEVTRASDSAVSVSPGFAIDGRGHEIEIQQAEVLELSSLPANSVLSISLSYEEEEPPYEERPIRKSYGVLTASTGIADAAVILATVQLDAQGRLTAGSIKTTSRHQLRTLLAPGSVTAIALDAHLRCGWVRMPFRPMAIPQDQAGAQPPFRVGPTEAVSHREYNGQVNTKGAAGTMAIAVPPSVTRIHRLRIAGAENNGKITVQLFVGGWDSDNKQHVAKRLLSKHITGGPYDETYEIAEGEIHSESGTLSLEVSSDGYTKISLVAVQVSY